MSLAASGQISLSDLRSEFGQSGTVSLNGFRRNNAYFSHSWDDNNQSNYGNRQGDPIGTISANSNIPNRGTTSAISLSNFHGANGYNDTVTIYCPANFSHTLFKQNYVGNGFAMCNYNGSNWQASYFGGTHPSQFSSPTMVASDVNGTYHTYKGARFVGTNAYRWSSGAKVNAPWFLEGISLAYYPAGTLLDFNMIAYGGYRSASMNHQNTGYVFNDCGQIVSGRSYSPYYEGSNQGVWGGGGSTAISGSNIVHDMTARTIYLSTTAGAKSVSFNGMFGNNNVTYGGHDTNGNFPNYYGNHNVLSSNDRRAYAAFRFIANTSTFAGQSFTFNANSNNTIQIT